MAGGISPARRGVTLDFFLPVRADLPPGITVRCTWRGRRGGHRQRPRAPENLSPFLNAGSNVAEQVVRWTRQGNRVLLRSISYGSLASDTLPIADPPVVNRRGGVARHCRRCR